MFAYLPFGCLGLQLLNLRKMDFSSVITDGPKNCDGSKDNESFQAILAVRAVSF